MLKFDLIDEGWIPCRFVGSATVQYVGLQQALADAHAIEEIVESSPLVVASLHRLLLAVLHRNFGPTDAEGWAELWRSRRFQTDALDTYWATWHHRFDLFDADRPFYQTNAIPVSEAGPASRLLQERSSGNNATLFDHSTDDDGQMLDAGHAARALVALQSFSLGGTISYDSAREDKSYHYAKAACLVKSAVAVVRGANLFETLLLNLHCYDPKQSQPFAATSGVDLPAWESSSAAVVSDRNAHGYLDLLTWQSRRIRLVPLNDQPAPTMVKSVVIMRGQQFPDSYNARDCETMVAFARNSRAKDDQLPWLSVSFAPECSVWRDSHALFRALNPDSCRPRTLSWLNDLVLTGAIPRSSVFAIDLFGIATDRAKALLWRQERMPLPVAYLENEQLCDSLQVALAKAEKTATVLEEAAFNFAENLFAPAEGRKADRKRVSQLVASLAPGRQYWSELDPLFGHLVVDLWNDSRKSGDGGAAAGDESLRRWLDQLRSAALAAFSATTARSGTTARSLRAASVAELKLRSQLRRVLAADEPSPASSSVQEIYESVR